MKIVNLSLINITADVYQDWNKIARRAVEDFAARGVMFNPADVPDEQGRLETDGSLTIFVVLPNGEEVSLRVPPEKWNWRFPKN